MKKMATQSYLPALVIIISVPYSLNPFHNVLLSNSARIFPFGFLFMSCISRKLEPPNSDAGELEKRAVSGFT